MYLVKKKKKTSSLEIIKKKKYRLNKNNLAKQYLKITMNTINKIRRNSN